MQTRITQLFGTKYPIIMGAMYWIASPQLVAAICNAGGLGMYPVSGDTPEQARKAIREIKSLTDRPFGINQMLASPSAKENIDIILDEKVPVIEYGLGRPWFIDKAHAYGGKVIAKISIIKHAVKAEQLGVDAVNIVGYEAAGHPTYVTTMVLIPLAAKSVKIPIIASGGISNGRGLVAALALGADAVIMGTRFAASKESLLNEKWKQRFIEASEQDTIYMDTGDPTANMRAFKTRRAEEELKQKFPIMEAISGALETKKLLNLSWSQMIRSGLASGEEGMSMKGKILFAASAARSEQVMIHGDESVGVLTAGQVVGDIKDIPSCQEIIDRTMAEAEEVFKQMKEKM